MYQPVECLDRATELCAGVPQRFYTDALQIVLGLREALDALRDCQEAHAELTVCVANHNAKAK